MSDFNIAAPGQINGLGDRRALMLKVFSGEVMATFEAENVFMPLHRVRTIQSGKSAQFPFIGNIGAVYHIPGAELVGQRINHAETIIPVDNLVVAQTTIGKFEEAMNHYDLRSQYSTELGRALQREIDGRLARLVARAARSLGPLAGTRYPNYGSSGAAPSGTGGLARDTSLQNASAHTSASILRGLIMTAIQRLDERNVPNADRYIVVSPAQFYLLMNSATGIGDSLLNQDVGGSGSISSGTIGPIAGARIIKSNLMPQLQFSKDAEGNNTGTQGDVTSDTTGNTGGNNYNGDFQTTVALVFQKEAVGTVKLMDLESESQYLIQRQADIMVSKYAMGHGVLRPECACEIARGDAAAAKYLPTA